MSAHIRRIRTVTSTSTVSRISTVTEQRAELFRVHSSARNQCSAATVTRNRQEQPSTMLLSTIDFVSPDRGSSCDGVQFIEDHQRVHQYIAASTPAAHHSRFELENLRRQCECNSQVHFWQLPDSASQTRSKLPGWPRVGEQEMCPLKQLGHTPGLGGPIN